ncbi:unnamed protein product [Orchesella dallaii]|uniref:SCP domain-containing protein n=1 Tax=Orchesella dallaii TaxID=48710 RepID=A0ABP1S780_9HEXA
MAKFCQLTLILHISVVGLAFADDSWKYELLDKENGNRARHQAAPLNYNEELAQKAQRWADQLAAECGKMHHEDTSSSPNAQYNGEGLGENIHFAGMVGGSPTNMQQFGERMAPGAADDWYDEEKYYPWPEFTGQELPHMVFHFTQEVWQGTREVGYGLGARDGCPSIYVVGRYYPGGNVLPMFGQNVLPPQ